MNDLIALSVVYTWMSFVCAIMIMRTRSAFKIQTIGVTAPPALRQLVWRTHDRVEFVMAALIVLCLFFLSNAPFAATTITFLIPVLILVVQKHWLMPALSQNETIYFNGTAVSQRDLRFFYLACDILKIGSLSVFSLNLL